MPIRFRLLQLIGLLLLPFLVVIAMVLLGYKSSYQVAKQMANTEIERNIDRSLNKIGELLLPVRSLVRVAGGLGSLSPEYFQNDESHTLLDEMLAHSSTIDSVYVGLPNGSFRMSVNADHQRWRADLGFPPETRLVHRWLVQGQGGQRIVFCCLTGKNNRFKP